MGGLWSKEEEDAIFYESEEINKEDFINEIRKYIDDRLEDAQQNAKEILEKVNDENKELETQNNHYRTEYERLYQKHEALIQEMEMRNTRSKISENAINAFVKTMMDDPKTNIRGFPDAIESALYKKALKTIMYAVAHTADVTSLHFMGHKISITIEPEEETSLA